MSAAGAALRGAVAAAVVTAPFAAHLALTRASDLAIRPAEALAAVQVGALAWIVAGGAAGRSVTARAGLAVAAGAAFLAAADTAETASLTVATAMSHAAIYLGVAVQFGRSLLPGREPLVSRLARQVEPCVTPALLAYTRRVTWLWAYVGAAQLGISALLLALAPLPVWSMFVNVLDAPLILLVFAVEYGVRRRCFRDVRMAGWAETARAFTRRGGGAQLSAS